MLSRPYDIAPVSLRKRRKHRAALEADPAVVARAAWFMSAGDPIVVIDLDGTLLDVNEAACRQLGYTRAELLALTAPELSRLTTETWHKIAAEMQQVRHRVVETRYYCGDGRVLPVELDFSLISHQGRAAFLSIARSIERRRSAAAELVRRNLALASLAAEALRSAQSLAISDPSLQGANPAPTPDVSALGTFLPVFVEHAQLLVSFDSAAIATYLPETTQFVVRLYQHQGANLLASPALWPCTPATLTTLLQAQPVLLPDGDVLGNLGATPSSDGQWQGRRGMVLPVIWGERLLGVLSLGRDQDPGFVLSDADPLRAFLDQLSMGIDSSHLLEEIRAQAISEERIRLSREMHDRIGQALAGAAAYSAVVAELLESGSVHKASKALDQVSDALQQAYADLRDALHGLRGVEGAPDDWAASLERYVRRYEQQWGIRCELQVDDTVAAACGPQGRAALTRIVQEALTNVRKHSQSKRASVSICVEDGSVLARVTDEGRGFNPADSTTGHYGLETMRERAASLGGELRISSGPAGTQVAVRVPARYGA